jgi:hypothetical protein
MIVKPQSKVHPDLLGLLGLKASKVCKGLKDPQVLELAQRGLLELPGPLVQQGLVVRAPQVQQGLQVPRDQLEPLVILVQQEGLELLELDQRELLVTLA